MDNYYSHNKYFKKLFGPCGSDQTLRRTHGVWSEPILFCPSRSQVSQMKSHFI